MEKVEHDWIYNFPVPSKQKSFVTQKFFEFLDKGVYNPVKDHFMTTLRPPANFTVPFKLIHHGLRPIDRNLELGQDIKNLVKGR